MKRGSLNLIWQEIHWPRPFQSADVMELLTHLAVLSPRKQIVWEVRGSGGKVRYFIGTDRRYMKPLKAALQAHGEIEFGNISSGNTEIGSVDIGRGGLGSSVGIKAIERGSGSSGESEKAGRIDVTVAKQLRRSKSALSLQTDNTLAVLKTALSALADTGEEETLVVQIVLGESFAPTPVPDKATDPHASLLDTVCGKVGTASKESLKSIQNKATQHGFYSLIRIGAKAPKRCRTNRLLLSLMSALRQFETAGVHFSFSSIDPELINQGKIPWFLSLRLSVQELAGFVLLPCTDTALAGINGLHPKLAHPPLWLKNVSEQWLPDQRCFAKSLGVNPVKLSIPIKDALEHTVILGPTGSGKSTVMLNLIMSDIKAGRGVLAIDPKADLVNDILARVPEERIDDVVVVDPSSVCPVGINPFIFNTQSTPSLVSDAILAVFKQIYKDSWGVYSEDVLSAALLTLAQTPNSTLLQLPALLTNDRFRQNITSKLQDKVGLTPFWAQFEAMSKAERRQTLAPVMNKLRQFTLRPALRNVLGQAQPKFKLSDLFDQNKIVLMPLNKGIIGAESSRLLGSLMVGLTWTLALSRAKLPASQRHPVSVYIDELQDYLALPTDFADALAQARGLGVAFTVAHQYRGQLSPAIKAALDANARNKIVFGLNAADAKDIAAMSPTGADSRLVPADFMALPRYNIYASFQNNGRSTGWLSGQTLPPTPTLRLPVELLARSQSRYGQEPVSPDIEATATPEPLTALFPIGRKKIEKTI